MNPFAEAEAAKEISEVSVVPLADVSLVLLIILLLLSPMMTQSMLKVKTAGRAVEPLTPIPEDFPKPPEVVLSVALTPSGYSIGDKTFAGELVFSAYLRDELVRREDKKVFLTPSPDSRHGDVVKAMELIKDCGAASVALVQVEDAPSGGPTSGEVRPVQAAP